MGLLIKKVLPICSNGSAPSNKMAAMPIYGKTLKNLLLQNQKSFESWYIASRTQSIPSFSNDDPRLTFDLFTAGQICVPIHLYGENVEKSFSQNVLKTYG